MNRYPFTDSKCVNREIGNEKTNKKKTTVNCEGETQIQYYYAQVIRAQSLLIHHYGTHTHMFNAYSEPIVRRTQVFVNHPSLIKHNDGKDQRKAEATLCLYDPVHVPFSFQTNS